MYSLLSTISSIQQRSYFGPNRPLANLRIDSASTAFPAILITPLKTQLEAVFTTLNPQFTAFSAGLNCGAANIKKVMVLVTWHDRVLMYHQSIVLFTSRPS